MFRIARSLVAASLTLIAAMPAVAGTFKCTADSVVVGNVCIDKYEASIWQIAPSNRSLLKLVQKGKATLAALTAGGAVQLGCSGAPFSLTAYPANFPNDGNWTPVLGSVPPSPGVYAVSIPGVLPSTCLTWFQANQACALSGKRLARNGEWQRAAAGTPDPGTDNGTTDCHVGGTFAPANTGSRSNCKSSWGVFDMVGNVSEWVEDWADNNSSSDCTDWTTSAGLAGGDLSCFGGTGVSGSNALPAALIRSGSPPAGSSTGVFFVNASVVPSNSADDLGVRCAR
jgi:formylglycine-generating enzyme required for sulfatase activity